MYYNSSDIVSITGITLNKLKYWSHTGDLVPMTSDTGKKYYTENQLVRAIELRDCKRNRAIRCFICGSNTPKEYVPGYFVMNIESRFTAEKCVTVFPSASSVIFLNNEPIGLDDIKNNTDLHMNPETLLRKAETAIKDSIGLLLNEDELKQRLRTAKKIAKQKLGTYNNLAVADTKENYIFSANWSVQTTCVLEVCKILGRDCKLYFPENSRQPGVICNNNGFAIVMPVIRIKEDRKIC